MFNAIETEAINHFVNQAKTVTPEQRAKVIEKMQNMINGATCPAYKGTKISADVMRETISQMKSL